eukprot:365318-Chlamydomonas_euryale.AAC.7
MAMRCGCVVVLARHMQPCWCRICIYPTCRRLGTCLVRWHACGKPYHVHTSPVLSSCRLGARALTRILSSWSCILTACIPAQPPVSAARKGRPGQRPDCAGVQQQPATHFCGASATAEDTHQARGPALPPHAAGAAGLSRQAERPHHAAAAPAPAAPSGPAAGGAAAASSESGVRGHVSLPAERGEHPAAGRGPQHALWHMDVRFCAPCQRRRHAHARCVHAWAGTAAPHGGGA